MIQPINALTPHVAFRGSQKTYGMQAKGFSEGGAALINAGGLSVAAGGLTAMVSRAYTRSWPNAIMLGALGSFLTLFFMTPSLIEKLGITKQATKAESVAVLKQDGKITAEAMRSQLKPVKKLVQFRQQS